MICKHKDNCKYYQENSYTCNVQDNKKYCGYYKKLVLLLPILICLIGIYGILGVSAISYYDIQYDNENNNSCYVLNSNWTNNDYYYFNGVKNSRLDCSQVINQGTQNSTFCAFINMNNVSSGKILDNLYGNGTNRSGSLLYATSASSFRFDFVNQSGNLFIARNSSYPIYPNRWYHVCGVWNTTNIMLYVDGNLIGINNTYGNSQQGIKNFTIGMQSDGTLKLNGSIDEIRIYNLALNSTDILEINNSGRKMNKSLLNQSLVTYFSFDSNSEIIISSSKGGGITNISTIYSNINDTNKINNYSLNGFNLYSRIKFLNTSFNSINELLKLESNENFTSSINITFDSIYLYANYTVNITNTTIVSFDRRLNKEDNNITRYNQSARGYLYIYGAYLYLTNSNLSYLGYFGGGNERNGVTCLYCYKSSIDNNIFSFNAIGFNGDNLYESNITNNTVFNITKISKGSTAGIRVYEGRNFRIRNNTVYNIRNTNGWEVDNTVGIIAQNGNNIDSCLVDYNYVYDSDSGIDLYLGFDNPRIRWNNITNVLGSCIKVENFHTNVNVTGNILNGCGETKSLSNRRNAIEIDVDTTESRIINMSIQDNIIYNALIPIRGYGINNLIIKNNIVINSSKNTSYGTDLFPIWLDSIYNLTLDGNWFGNTYRKEYYLMGISNATIKNINQTNNNNFRFYYDATNYPTYANDTNSSNINFIDTYNINPIIFAGTNLINLTFSTPSYFTINSTKQYNISIISNPNTLIIYQNLTGEINNNNINLVHSNLSNNKTYILPNFNCSESLQTSSGYSCGRENSPIWIYSSSDTSKHIASNLTNYVNISVFVNKASGYNCNHITSISYKSGQNNYSHTWNANAGQALCSDTTGLITFNGLEIEYSQNSNEITISYENIYPYCESISQGLGKFGTWIALIVLSLVVAVVYGFITNQKMNEMDGGSLLKTYILGGVIVLVMASIILVFGLLLIEGVC